MSTDDAALRKEFYEATDDALFDRRTIAAVHYLSTTTLEAMASRGDGPVYARVGRRALYRKADVMAWSGRRLRNERQQEPA